MNNKSIESITKKIGKALAVPQEIKPLRKKLKRAKPLKYDTGEKVFKKQLDEIISGKKKTKKTKWPNEKHGKDDEKSVQKAR